MSRFNSKVEIINSNANIQSNDVLKKTKSVVINHKVNDLISSSTIHGIPNAFKSNNHCIRSMWLILTMFSLLGCSFFIFKAVNDYLSFEVVTTINTINEQEVEFPTISFCKTTTSNSSMELVILRCFFMGDNGCELNSSNYFEKFQDPLYGTCYRFNSGKNMFGISTEILKSYVTGPFFGFILDLNVTGNLSLNELTVNIHNRSQIPTSLFNTGYGIVSGSRNFFVVQRNYDYKLPKPYNECFKDVTLSKANKTLINFILSKNRSYTQTECLYLCNNLKYLESKQCQCGFDQELEVALGFCLRGQSNILLKACVQKYLRNIQNKSCAEYCPLECDSATYSVSLYTETINVVSGNLTLEQTFFKNLTNFDQVRKSFFSISVYYDQLRYTRMEQQPKMEIVDLLSNVGGILGVFLGVSFLSFFELFECFIELICISIFQKY